METFKDRLIFLWKNEAKQAKIASDIEMTIAGFSRIWNEGGLPKSETLKKIKQLKGCSIDWLLTGEGEPFPGGNQVKSVAYDTFGNEVDTDEFVFVPRYDIRAAAGYGQFVGHEEPVFTMAFRRHWIENYVTRDTKNLSVISVKGDSMEGVLMMEIPSWSTMGKIRQRMACTCCGLMKTCWSNVCKLFPAG